MKYLINFSIFLSFLFCDNSSLINDLYYNTVWDKYDVNEKKQEIFVGSSSTKNVEYMKIQQLVEFDKQKLFSLIKNLNLYDQIISNKKISTKLIYSENDTLYGHQLITNMIPFIRDREYVFKMYMVDENRLDWILLKMDNILLSEYSDKKNNTLTCGAGSWEMQNDNLLTFRIYVDDEVNLPSLFLNRLKRNHVIQIFDDVLNYIEKQKGDKIE